MTSPSQLDQEDSTMTRKNAVALALALATTLVTTVASAVPPPREEVQAPRGEDHVEAPRR
jgi:hypothetical protein